MLWVSSCFKIKSSIYFSEASKWMFISRCPYKETRSSFFPHFLICLYYILLLIVFFFLGNPLCHTTEILLTERIVSPVWHILTIQQVRMLILILHGIKMQALDFMGVCSAYIAIGFPPNFFKQLQARVKLVLVWFVFFTIQWQTLKSLDWLKNFKIRMLNLPLGLTITYTSYCKVLTFTRNEILYAMNSHLTLIKYKL